MFRRLCSTAVQHYLGLAIIMTICYISWADTLKLSNRCIIRLLADIVSNAAGDLAENVARSFFESVDAALSDAVALSNAIRAYLALFPAIQATLRYGIALPPGSDATRVDIFSRVSMANVSMANVSMANASMANVTAPAANHTSSVFSSVVGRCIGASSAAVPGSGRPGGSPPGGNPMLAARLHEGLVNCVLSTYLNQSAPAVVHLRQVWQALSCT